MKTLSEELEEERMLHETSQRERDKYSSEKYALQHTITSLEDEIVQMKRKIDRLNEEIEDYGRTEKSNEEVSEKF